MTELTWRKSSYSGGANGECVEVATGATVGIRDTKDRAGGQLAVPSAAWSALADELKRN